MKILVGKPRFVVLPNQLRIQTVKLSIESD